MKVGSVNFELGLTVSNRRARTSKTFFTAVINIDIESLQNRLLKVCYVPATSAGLPRVSFFFSFLFLLVRPFTVLNEANKAGSTRRLAVYMFLDVYGN